MRHRMITGTGLGNSEPVLLTNTGTLTPIIKKMMEESFDLWKPLQYGADYTIHDHHVVWGREPAYQYEELTILCLERTKDLSYIQTGKSFGGYGSAIRSRYKFYKDYKNKTKFTRFIDKWHTQVFKVND